MKTAGLAGQAGHWSPARRPFLAERRHRHRRQGRAAPAAARPAPRGLLGGGGKGARCARGCCGVSAARRALPCPALPAFVWPRRGPAPAQVRPRRPEPRPRRGGARPGPPALPARCRREPARSRQGECPARPSRGAGGARRRWQGPARPGHGAGAAGTDNAGRAGGLLAVPAAACGQTPAERETSPGCGGASGAAGTSGGGAPQEGAGDGGDAASCTREAVLEGASLGEGGS